ncbi:MAG: CHAT domain-containing protein, partial [Planctomycetes bacterium]|nr:CHAT domain-containing protein [Planctomycetota bacterium]
RPLRILFTACAPTQLAGLDYEKEEEAILRIADRLGDKVHLDIAEAGAFDELRDLIAERKPHIVHLSGHGVLKDGVGHFAFEDERGGKDERDGREMAERLFAGKGVRVVFVSGCQSAQAGAAGLCQTLTATGHVPIVLGWGASIGDMAATEFARVFFHELAAGQPVDYAVAAARRELLSRGRVRLRGLDLLDASFALPQVYAADDTNDLVNERRPAERPERPGVRYELLGDNIRGLREGFVGRRRVLQRTRPALRSGEKTLVLLTGIGGSGKSTLATRLANRCKLDGFRIAPLQARREEAPQFLLRLLTELATACQRLGREADERMLRDGQRPLPDRLRLAVEILNEAKILLVLDNLEALMPPPPAPPRWDDPCFAAFLRELAARLTGQGRAILTCRYVPEGFDPRQPNLAHEPLPDFTEADFFKYLRRHDRVASRMDQGELPRELLGLFHAKLGATPRFVEQASAVLATIDPDRLREALEGLAAPTADQDPDEIRRLQHDYFRDLFLPELYDALAPEFRLGLSRLAVVEVPLPLDGVAAVAGFAEPQAQEALGRWLRLGLLQRFGEPGEIPLWAVYPLQREFLTQADRLGGPAAREAHGTAAAFFQNCYEKDREEELRLPIGVELLACLHHATAAGDKERQCWAAVALSWRLISRAEYAA